MKELAERDTSGAIAVVYDEIKRVCAVPYVSSMQLYVLLTTARWSMHLG